MQRKATLTSFHLNSRSRGGFIYKLVKLSEHFVKQNSTAA